LRHVDGVVKGGWKRLSFAIALAGVLLALLATRAGSALVIRAPLSQPDAVISLGSHERERLPLAARLATANPRAIVLLTQPPEVTTHNCEDCPHRVDRLGKLGVLSTRVRVLPIVGSGTHGEAVAALAFAREAGVQRLLIVTSPYHTRRALAVFRRVFAETGVTLGVEPAIDTSPAQPTRWWLGSYDRGYVAYEWAAIVYYVAKYRVDLGALTDGVPE
jgi:uncharacterized SAM-binding protein YcdF (DUF218 family)